MNQLSINEFLFDEYFRIWKCFVEKNGKEDFKSFGSNTYLFNKEGYKEYEIWPKAMSILDKNSWKPEDIGTGKILKKIIAAIEIPQNNLLSWRAIWGERSKNHIALCEALGTKKQQKIEGIFFNLYKKNVDDRDSFNLLLNEVGKKYSLMAYLFFLKDMSKYVPIAPKFFDDSFLKLGIDFKTSKRCSWENYCTYNNILNQIKYLLSDRLQCDVKLIDAHSFVWMISAYKIDEDQKIKEINGDCKDAVAKKARETLIRARIGQGTFRNRLLEYWGSSCSVSGCNASEVLIASHIKPWSDCSNDSEATDSFNGLLLTPNYDKLFDLGYISFDDNGNIMLSSKLSEKNIEILGIDKNIKLKITDQHKKYLEYHRKKYNF